MKRENFEFLEFIDLFPVEPSFSFQKKRFYKTSLGGMMSIVLIICIILLAFVFGRELFEKTTPTIIQELIPKPRMDNLTYDISTGITVEDQFANVKPNYERYVSITAAKKYVLYTKNDDEYYSGQIISEPLPSFKCKKDYFSPGVYYYFDLNNLQEATCIENDEIVGGFYNLDYVSYLSLTVAP